MVEHQRNWYRFSISITLFPNHLKWNSSKGSKLTCYIILSISHRKFVNRRAIKAIEVVLNCISSELINKQFPSYDSIIIVNNYPLRWLAPCRSKSVNNKSFHCQIIIRVNEIAYQHFKISHTVSPYTIMEDRTSSGTVGTVLSLSTNSKRTRYGFSVPSYTRCGYWI